MTMATMSKDDDRDVNGERLCDRTGRQSSFAILFSVAAHMMLIVMLYQFGLVRLTNSNRDHTLIAMLPVENELLPISEWLEIDVDPQSPVAIDEPSPADLPSPSPSELHRSRGRTALTTTTVPKIRRRDTANAGIADAGSAAAAPPIDLSELSDRALPRADG